uniref:Uncharacterized protein n=1 Tax=Globodera pallida TaxID=36090 RepID=A0A183C8W8_GLOPA
MPLSPSAFGQRFTPSSKLPFSSGSSASSHNANTSSWHNRTFSAIITVLVSVPPLLALQRSLRVFSTMQLAIFGWQMAAIKYEKDRAANTLLPNYNTYGRYDIPTYYEAYWQSPEERYYTWLFVIQILCLIVAFFLLFASIMMIYGVMWWAGDVRDYWLMLTIVEMFGVFLNTYCFLVIIMFHRRMLVELEYYARRRKYDRFNQLPRGTPQHTIEQGNKNSAEWAHSKEKGQENFKRHGNGRQWDVFSKRPISPPPQLSHRPFYRMNKFDPARQWNNGHKNRNLTNIEKFRDKPNGGQLLTGKKVRAKCAVGNTFNTAAIVATHRSTAIVTEFPVEDTENCRAHRQNGGRAEDGDGVGRNGTEEVHGNRTEVNLDIRCKPRRRFPSMEGRQQQKDQRSRTLFQANEGQLNRMGSTGTLPRSSQQFLLPNRGISIPQHIVIPPVAARTCETLDPRKERKYRINSEITVSYDPKERQQHNGWSPSRKNPPNIPPRTPHQGLFPQPAGYINLNTNSVHVPTERREPIQQQLVQPLPDQSPRHGQLISMNSNV